MLTSKYSDHLFKKNLKNNFDWKISKIPNKNSEKFPEKYFEKYGLDLAIEPAKFTKYLKTYF